jgi:transposase-like protein
VLGLVDRESGQIRLHVCPDTKQDTIEPLVHEATDYGQIIYTDEAGAYNHINEFGLIHMTVCYSDGEWAADFDGDGINEVHCNTMEGIWTGLRNFLRTFRGVSKEYLVQYVAMFEWAHNLKRVSPEYLRLLSVPHYTFFPHEPL